MTAMFRPPETAETPVAAGDLLRLGDVDDPFWQRVRERQYAFLSRYTAFGGGFLIANAGMLLAMLDNGIALPVLAGWSIVNIGILLLCAVRFAARRRGLPMKATPVRLRLMIAMLAVAGASWGVMFGHVLPRSSPDQAILALAMALSTVGCISFAGAIFPLAVIAIVTPVMLGTVTGILASGWPTAPLTALVFVGFTLMVLRSTATSTRLFLSEQRVQDRLAGQEKMLRHLFDELETNGHDWLFEIDRVGRLTFVSGGMAEAAGLSADAILGRHWSFFVSDPRSAEPLAADIREGRPFRDMVTPIHVRGQQRWWRISGTPTRDADGVLTGYRGVASDVTERELAARHIEKLASCDPLTGLMNRRLLHLRLEERLRAGRGTILMFVDLDRFKLVNDSLGHGLGDRLLHDVAVRLGDIVGKAGHVGRLGGDEFAVVVPGADVAGAVDLGLRIIARLSEPYPLGNAQACIGASIGLAAGPRDGACVEDLMRAADLALYDVKARGRGNVRVYDREMHRRAEERRLLEFDLRSALDRGQLHLAFQPIVDAQNEEVVGFEALMRWNHPERGGVSPAVFIPIAEEAGLIGEMGTWALDAACRTASGWPQHIHLCVNISPVQFADPMLVEKVVATLERWNIAPRRLELELTESIFLDERPQTIAMLAQLRALGIGFALDDFGTGYASLGYLQKISFTRIKIDRSFVQASSADGGESTAIIQAIVALAEKLGMQTTAEGTETRAEFEEMRRLGCAQVQGYYFGKPMPPEDAARLLESSRPILEMVPEPLPGSVGNRPMPLRLLPTSL